MHIAGERASDLKLSLLQQSDVMDGNRGVCVHVALVLKNELQKAVQYKKTSKKRNAGVQHPNFSKDLKVRQ